MRRFALNRWCAFLLTLCVLLASSTVMAPSSFGEGTSPDPLVIGGGSGGPDPGGDPDGTAGGGSKRSAGSGRALPGGSWFAASSAGDGGGAMSAWVMRLHVVLRSLTSRLYRF
jgi:hypothetical protein